MELLDHYSEIVITATFTAGLVLMGVAYLTGMLEIAKFKKYAVWLLVLHIPLAVAAVILNFDPPQ